MCIRANGNHNASQKIVVNDKVALFTWHLAIGSLRALGHKGTTIREYSHPTDVACTRRNILRCTKEVAFSIRFRLTLRSHDEPLCRFTPFPIPRLARAFYCPHFGVHAAIHLATSCHAASRENSANASRAVYRKSTASQCGRGQNCRPCRC